MQTWLCTPSKGIGRALRVSCPRLLSLKPVKRQYAAAYTPSAPRRYGQPLPTSHPHLLKEGELTPGIAEEEYERRRKRLMETLPEGSVVVAVGASVQYSSPGIFYRFRQQPDLFYLTGWLEPDSALILEKTPSKRGFRMTMYVSPNDPAWEAWHGPRTGIQGAIDIFGADDAVDVDLFAARLRALLADKQASGALYMDVPDHLDGPGQSRASPAPKRSLIERLSHRQSPPTMFTSAKVLKQHDYDAVLSMLASPESVSRGLKPLKNAVEPLRLIKSDAEVALMRRAADIAGEAHAQVMAFSQPGRSEAQMAAHFEYHCAAGGPVQPAFVPVCASGESALALHYTANDRLMPDNELVLFDGGCVYAGYASDISRTFPVNGRFSEPQEDLYAAVLASTKAVIELCTARQERSLRGLHRESVEILRKELAQLGIKLNAGDLERRLYPHFVGHFLGLDLHDTPTCDRSLRLQAGMVLAVEPGIYIPHDTAFPKHYQGLAVRIEEVVHVQQDDYHLLSANTPRELVDVEACCQR